MSFRNLFQKRERQESCDDFKIVLKTEMKLSEEQKNAIIAIVKDGISNGLDNSDIAIMIMTYANVLVSKVTIYRKPNSFEVSF